MTFKGENERDGSKGWRRPDDRICQDVTVALDGDAGIDAGDIDVRVAEGEVTLTGTVADKFARQRAEHIAHGVFGVTDVQNMLRIKRDGDGVEASAGRRGDREVKRTAERDDGFPPAPSPSRRRKPPPSAPETLDD
ncbi:MAG: BON domain-containing protein [Cytophagaceae bacterium]|nr:BON domain-containing protein [Gemmatimonadaceae bacterium]